MFLDITFLFVNQFLNFLFDKISIRGPVINRRPVIDHFVIIHFVIISWLFSRNILNHPCVSLDFWNKVWAHILKCKITSPAVLSNIFLMLKVEWVLVGRPGMVARLEACPLGMQAAPSSIPTSGTFFRGDLVMKTFLRPFSLFHWFKKSSCQLLAKECALSIGKLPRRLAQEQCG